jgi:glutamyl-tRNA reductase
MTGPVLDRLFPAALRCGARVRDETTLGAQARSLGHRAVDVGLAALPGVGDPVIMVVGSGRMASTAVEHLTRMGRRPYVAARNEAHAARLVGPGLVCPLPALARGLERADLLICATSAAHHVVTLDHVRHAMAARVRPLTVVDLTVPRNVDAAVGSLAGVRLIDLEGMNDDAATDPALAAALEAGAALVTAEAQRYADAVAARGAGPVIAALRQHVEETCLRELARVVTPRTVDMMISPEPRTPSPASCCTDRRSPPGRRLPQGTATPCRRSARSSASGCPTSIGLAPEPYRVKPRPSRAGRAPPIRARRRPGPSRS